MSPPEEGAAGADGKPPRGDASLFTPGYSAGGQARDQDPFLAGGGWYGPGGAAGKGPIRGFPPAPGQPPPLYPPGQFSAWNRASGQGDNGYDPNASDTWLALDYAGSAGDDYPEPGAGDQGYGDPGPEQAGAGFGETAYAGVPGAGPGRTRLRGPRGQRAGRGCNVHPGLGDRGQRPARQPLAGPGHHG